MFNTGFKISIIAKILIIVISVQIMTGCVDYDTGEQKDYGSKKTTGEGVNKDMSENPLMGQSILGNTNGNIVNQGHAVFDGQWIYITTPEDVYEGRVISKYNKESMERVVICDDDTRYKKNLNIVNEWLYYSGEDGIYRIKNDGNSKERISDLIPEEMIIAAEWIYCLAGGGVYRIKLDGKEIINLYEDWNPCYLNIFNNWVYFYTNTEGKEGIYRIKTDGSIHEKLSDDTTYSINVSNGKIYYIPSSRSMYSMNLDGTDKKEFIKSDNMILMNNINVEENWIYYVDSPAVMRINKESTQKEKIKECDARGIVLVDEWIFYCTMERSGEADVYEYHRIKKDGSSYEKINNTGNGKSLENNTDHNNDIDSVINNNMDSLAGAKADSFNEDEFIKLVIREKVNSINKNEFSRIEEYVDSKSNAYEYMKNQFEELKEKKVELELVNFRFISTNLIEETEKGYIKEFTIQESIVYNYFDNKVKENVNNVIYVVRYDAYLDEFKVIDMK
ncbi:MAG: DUF5050 domain-containing protein [Clostridiaceae bacterium]|nr:DUF5050 domain-containing protein [Clostridiaceae bacterium]